MMRAPFVPCVILAAAGAMSACTDESVFTSEERAQLQTYKLPASLPVNPSNRVADDTNAAILGKKFFFDTRFSGTLGPANDGVTNGSLGKSGDLGKVACVSCHAVADGGGDRRSRPGTVSLGVNYGRRNAPTVINTGYSELTQNGGYQLWDGRKDSLWAVALGPLEGANEHAGTRLAYSHLIFDKYRADYEQVFGAMPDLSDTARFPAAGKPGVPAFDNMAPEDKKEVNKIYANLGKALEAYQRKLVSPNFEPSAFDKMLAGDDTAMTPAAIRGARLFVGKAACNECHNGAMFTDFKFHNIGCPQQGEFVPTQDRGRFSGLALLKADIFNRMGEFSDSRKDSLENLDPTMPPAELDGAFKTPSLRNIAKTGPYMHDGVYRDLWEVVEHYNFGGNTGAYSGTKEVTISPLLLDADELNDLVEFLRSLSDGPPTAVDGFPEGLTNTPTLPM